MKIIKLILGAFDTNTYVLIKDGHSVVIDPAANAVKILLSVAGMKFDRILLTHGHFDHTSAAQDLKELYAAKGTPPKIYIHEKDAPMLNDVEKSFASFMPRLFKPCQADVLVKDGDVIKFGESEITVMNTPGHSRGSVMFIIDDVIFTGDTLFKGSVGRVDGWSGDYNEQMLSLEKIKAMDGDYRIMPGHGEDSTLEFEMLTNPYLCS
jgi:glyoxylase-like metal-dependent hydrolase (beta-lactamase superfamily II)